MSVKHHTVTFCVTEMHIGYVLSDEYTRDAGLRLGCVLTGDMTDESAPDRSCRFVVPLSEENYDFADRELEVYCHLWGCRSAVSPGEVLDAVPGRPITLPDGRSATVLTRMCYNEAYAWSLQ
ncbi:hypothetical protein K9258_002923 [Salmonella enterica subsp. enterica serovar Chester]|nr:hypothetical protein [Salmonella enterica subsp. enterica serovar Chester]